MYVEGNFHTSALKEPTHALQPGGSRLVTAPGICLDEDVLVDFMNSAHLPRTQNLPCRRELSETWQTPTGRCHRTLKDMEAGVAPED